MTKPPQKAAVRAELLERFGRLKPIVEGMAYKMRPADEDMLQTGLCALWEMVVRDEYQDDALIVTAVRHDMIDRIRYQRMREKSERVAEACLLAPPEEEQMREVLDVLSVLPTPLRKTFHLRFVLGLTSAEVAAKLGVCVRTVELRIARAKKMLRQELE